MLARKLLVTAGIAGVMALAASAYANNNISAQDFVAKASIANMFEIESSKLALDKSQNEDVKSFAKTMVNDHSNVGNDMKAALKDSASGAQPAEALDEKHQNLLAGLKDANGGDFDTQYINIQTDAHKEAVDLFTNYSATGNDAALKDFATKTLPALKEHLRHVKQVKANLK